MKTFHIMKISCWILLTMRNISNKSWRENQNTHFVFHNFLPHIVALKSNIEKYGEARGNRRWQYGGALHAGLVRLYARKYTPALVHPQPLKYANTHACTLTHASAFTNTHTEPETSNTYWFSTATMILWTRLKITLYVHCFSGFGIKSLGNFLDTGA